METRRVFELLDTIEDKTKSMAHELNAINKSLRQWQDKELESSYFIAKLTKYLDQLNKGEQNNGKNYMATTQKPI
jgi:hypothetical protein